MAGRIQAERLADIFSADRRFDYATANVTARRTKPTLRNESS